ncbi:DUF5017 domain-containing protein [Bacteroides pyogenes]|uniref:DUF5017 domain-containing protein n=1 Tax=Bacteroides pyogenes TaxID=310300 RepID=UPI0003DC3787|nr:DUF5017 domain-containing protein [Bacteroides pyogenes]MBB3894095.1 plastocyanin [Bacteroides pyogenes]GAE20806.1 hypothetical protein JCM10003_180 [Bacteroides pyogenes JCM 10003]SUV31837.1 PKD domain [Bacteroides pyogenes]
MKRYKLAILAGVMGAFVASCDKELKEDTKLHVSVAAEENVGFDGKTVTVKKGTPVTFNFSGDPDFITFFSGETGYEYAHKDRTEMTEADVLKCNLTFSIWAQNGKAENILSMYIADSFPGIAKNNFEADSTLVEKFAWSELIPKHQLPQKVVNSADKATPYDIDLKPYLGKKITLAICYKGVSNTDPQSRFNFLDMQIEKAFNNGQSEAKPANSFGFTPVNMDNKKNFKDQEKASYKPKKENKEYGYVTNNIAGIWNLANLTKFFIHSSNKGTDLKYSWLVSDPISIDNLCNPDMGVGIKNITQSLTSYTHTYKEAGTYTATFVANNANYLHHGGEVVRELTIHVTE